MNSEQTTKEDIKKTLRWANQQWVKYYCKHGDLSRDLFVPALEERIIPKFFQEDVLESATRTEILNKQTGSWQVFRGYLASETHLFVLENSEFADERDLNLLTEKASLLKRLLPRFKDLQAVPIYATIHFEDDFIPLASQKNIYLLAYREWEYMDILNFEAIQQNKKV